VHLPSTSACKPRHVSWPSDLDTRPRTLGGGWRRVALLYLAPFVIAVITASVVNNCTVSTDEAVLEAPSIIDTEAAVSASGHH